MPRTTAAIRTSRGVHHRRLLDIAGSTPADNRHDLHLVPRLQRRVVLLAPDQPPIQLDGDFVGGEIELGDELAERGLLVELAGLAVDGDGDHGRIVYTKFVRCHRGPRNPTHAYTT